MARPRKENEVSQMRMEKPKTVSVQIVRCQHCGEDEKYSQVVKYGDVFNVMVCRSKACLGTTAGIGRRWVRKNG